MSNKIDLLLLVTCLYVAMLKETHPELVTLLNKGIGEVLRQIRKSHNPKVNQEDLAAATGKPRTYFSALENGKENPTIETLVIICQALDVELDDVIRQAKPMYNEKVAQLRQGYKY